MDKVMQCVEKGETSLIPIRLLLFLPKNPFRRSCSDFSTLHWELRNSDACTNANFTLQLEYEQHDFPNATVYAPQKHFEVEDITFSLYPLISSFMIFILTKKLLEEEMDSNYVLST